MRRGEVWWSSPRLTGGSARKRRPLLIVSHDAFNANDRYPKVLVVHLTSVQRAHPFDWEVSVPRGTAGLPHASTAKCAEIYTLLKEQLMERAGTLPAALLRQVDRALATTLSLPVPD